uniref:Uncharacterized protein n=1 Tax=Tanacetum cinerariifolium TaxID=118510 RepID=A0A6L2NYB8_TANCI|nr:hypothetical protein [Tanacetum cinerariifolium]
MAKNEVNEIRAERLACTANLLALVAQQQPVYHPQTNPAHYTQSSSTISQAATRNRGKAIVNPPQPTYDPEPEVVTDDDASLKEKEVDKLMDLISMSFKKIYKPTNNNLKISSNFRNLNVDNTLRSSRGTSFGPIFDAEPLQKVHKCDDDYNVFANERQHPEQPESVNDTYVMEQGDTNIIHDSSDMSNNGEEIDQDDQKL